jgi:hypothetical protein
MVEIVTYGLDESIIDMSDSTLTVQYKEYRCIAFVNVVLIEVMHVIHRLEIFAEGAE